MKLAMFEKGQKVDHHWISAGCAPGCGEPTWTWSTGFIIVEPVSPYADGCALIERIDGGAINIPFNAAYRHLRLTKQNCSTHRSGRTGSI